MDLLYCKSCIIVIDYIGTKGALRVLLDFGELLIGNHGDFSVMETSSGLPERQSWGSRGRWFKSSHSDQEKVPNSYEFGAFSFLSA